MKRNLLHLIALVCLCNLIQAQKIEEIPLDEQLHKPYEFSSIDIENDTLYIMSETCTSYFKIDSNTGKTLEETSFANADTQYDIEGFCNYKNGFFFSDETDNSIYYVSNNSEKLLPTKLIHIVSQQNRNRDFGIEGVSVNEDKKMLYLIKEFGKNKTATLYCYQINDEDEKISLDLTKTINIGLGNMFRYTDVTYNSQKNELYLLRTKFKNYFIDVIPLDENTGIPAQSNYKYENFSTHNISGKINPYFEKEYSTNMEGITVDGNGTIYLISDNYTGRDKTCESNTPGDRKTLLIKVSLD